ncbi:MAG TPA: T9SS type A sorting domain-containing protein, partial [Chitinophagaceae bacterium]
RMDLSFAQNFKLTAVPQNVGAGNSGANIDIKVSLLNATGDTIGRYNPSLLLNAGVDTNLYEGTYYLVAEGTGNANLIDYGSVGFYSMTGELNRVLPLQRFRLTGSASNGMHSLAWSYMANEEIGEFEVQHSDDGAKFEKLLAVQPAERNVTYRPLTSRKLFYRVKARTPDERTYYSNIISLQPGVDNKPVQVINSLVRNTLSINSTGQYRYQIIQQNGQLVQSGSLKTGLNTLDVQPTASGLMILRVYDGNQYWTEKLVTE